MESASSGPVGWKSRKRGGKRPNAGRPKLTTPAKRARYASKVVNLRVSRSVRRKKFYKLEKQLAKMKSRGQSHTDEYRTLVIEYVKLSKLSRRKASEELCCGIVPSLPEENAPELMQDDLEGHSSSSGDSSSSDEVWKQ